LRRRGPPVVHTGRTEGRESTEGTGSTYGGNWEYPEGTESAERGTFRVEYLAPTHRSSPATTPPMFFL